MHIPVLLGAAVFVLLGAIHAVLTLRSRPSGGPMTPVAPVVRDAMVQPGGLGLAPDIDSNLWRAWVGFNLSHSLGVVAIGLMIGVPALSDLEGVSSNSAWLVLAVASPAVYLVLSIRYWFTDPSVGIAIGGALIYAGLIGQVLR
jgi:hypothetical protein